MRRHLTYANVISTFCLVMVVGGGAAYAANTISSSDIINGQVKSVDIGTAAVATVDIAADAVDSSKIDDNTVTTADVANNSLRGADVASNSLDGLDIQEGSLVLNEHFSAVTSPTSGCTDDQHTGAICATTTLNLERSGRILMNASGQWRTTSAQRHLGPGGEHGQLHRGGGILRASRRWQLGLHAHQDGRALGGRARSAHASLGFPWDVRAHGPER